MTFLRPGQIKREISYCEAGQSDEAVKAMCGRALGKAAADLFEMQHVEIAEEGWNEGADFLAQVRDEFGASPDDIQTILEHHYPDVFWNLDCHEWTLDTDRPDYWQPWRDTGDIERRRGPVIRELPE